MAADEATVDPGGFVGHLRERRYRELTMALATTMVGVGAIALFPGIESVTRGIRANVGALEIALLIGVVIVAGITKGAIGFGYSLITTPIFATVIDPTMAVVVLAIPPWMINVFQVGETDTGLEYVRREWALIALAIAGSVIGVFALTTYSAGPLVPFLIGLTILGYVVFQVLKGFVTIPQAHNPVALGSMGFVEGFLLAVANLGPPLPAYLHTFERDADRYVGGLAMVLGAIFTTRIVQMLLNGLMTPYRLWLGSTIAVVTIVGLLGGTYLRRLRIDERKLNWAVTALLFVIALNILRQTIPALVL